MSLPAWLRFAELSILAAWLAWRFYRPGAGKRRQALAPIAVALLAIAQLLLEAQSATDPFTGVLAVLPVVAGTPYGVLSAAVVALGIAIAALLWRSRMPDPLAYASAAILLLCSGAASVGAADAIDAAAATGEIAMSPTLAVPRSATTTRNPYADDPTSAQRGAAVYQQYCAACHGLNGDGNGPAGAGLRVKPPSFRNPQHFLAPGMDGAHYWVIQHGDGVPGGMPAWQGTLTDRQIWDALDYVKVMAAR